MNFYISVLGIFSVDLLTSENFQPTSLRPWNASNPSPFTGISTHSFPKETPNLTFSCMSNALVTDFYNLLFSYNLFSLVLFFSILQGTISMLYTCLTIMPVFDLLHDIMTCPYFNYRAVFVLFYRTSVILI